MRFIAKYIPWPINKDSKPEEPYFRTIDADSITEAMRTAARYQRKGFSCSTLKQKELSE